MYPVVKEFYNSSLPLSDVIKNFGHLEEPVDAALLEIMQKVTSKEIPDEAFYKQMDEAVKAGHPDQEMFLFFLSFLLVQYCGTLLTANSHDFLPAKANSIYRISSSLEINNYSSETQAYYYQACSMFFIVNNNFIKADQLELLAISKMPKESLRYPRFLTRSSGMMGYMGRLSFIPKLENELKGIKFQGSYNSQKIPFFNALFTVNLDLITKYYQGLITNFKEDMQQEKVAKINYAIAVLNGNFEETTTHFPEMKTCVAYYKALKNGDLEIAKKVFVNIRESYLYFSCYYLFYFAEYHHSFVTGWFENIEQVIKNKEEKGYHYMLDLFIARYFLVKKNKDLARFYYAQLLKNCENYNAIGRLKFELQFAFEINALSFFDFTYPRQIINSAELRKSLEIAIIPYSFDLFGLNRIIGNTKAINDIKKKVKLFADIQRPILLIGETGVGKEVIARAIHEESSHKNKPFLTINCGALTDTLLQSELFGYEAGAFTGAVNPHKGIFEAAEDGVVFLDEFGEMSPKLQVSLLRILENNEMLRVGGTKVKEIKCRIIAATNANIEELIHKKMFREDLFHRLKQFTISIPPLRERKSDISVLVNYFLNQPNIEKLQVFSQELMVKFQEYHWPGNIRELKNEIDRIKILCGYKTTIELVDCEIEWIKKINPHPKNITLHSNSMDNIENEPKKIRVIHKKLSSGEKRKQEIVLLFQQHKQLTRMQLAEALEVSLITITRDLQLLCAEEIIVKRMPTLSPQSHFFEIKEF